MKLWLIYQNVNNNYDTYDSAVVAAETEEQARLTYPNSDYSISWRNDDWYFEGSHNYRDSSWANPRDVTVKYLAEYDGKAGVICASFNAG